MNIIFLVLCLAQVLWHVVISQKFESFIDNFIKLYIISPFTHCGGSTTPILEIWLGLEPLIFF
jgi:hypothetical protein